MEQETTEKEPCLIPAELEQSQTQTEKQPPVPIGTSVDYPDEEQIREPTPDEGTLLD